MIEFLSLIVAVSVIVGIVYGLVRLAGIFLGCRVTGCDVGPSTPESHREFVGKWLVAMRCTRCGRATIRQRESSGD